MSAPPMPPGPPRPPGMRATAPPVPPSFKANIVGSSAAGSNQPLRMPPLPPGIARPLPPQRMAPEGAPMHSSAYPRQGMPPAPAASRDAGHYPQQLYNERAPYPPTHPSSSPLPPQNLSRPPRPGPHYPEDVYERPLPHGPAGPPLRMPLPSPQQQHQQQQHPSMMPHPSLQQHPPQERMPMNEMYKRERERDRYMYDERDMQRRYDEGPYPRSAYPPSGAPPPPSSFAPSSSSSASGPFPPNRNDFYDDRYNRFDPRGYSDAYPRREEYTPYGAGRYAGPSGPYPRKGFHGSEESVLKLRDPTNTVWVGSLDPIAHSNEKLIRAMGEFGKIMQIARHDDKSFCFVHYRRVEEAERAVETLAKTKKLGVAVFNYGKMFTYSQEEMDMPYDPHDPMANREILEPPMPHSLSNDNGSSSNSNTRAMAGHYSGQQDGGNATATEYASDARPPLPAHLSQSSMPHRANSSYQGSTNSEVGNAGRPTQRTRYERDLKEPTNVLWIGSLPPSISEAKLREVFEAFGTILQISRMERQMMAFIHFDTVEHCTLAIETMKGRPIEDGVVLALNYGHSQRATVSKEENVASGGIPANEVATNVVYLGQLPANVDERDIEQLLSPFEGFINTKYIVSSNVGFGHFDTVEHAKQARLALHGATMKGVPIRVGFGKQNHTFTMADRRLAGVGASGTGNDHSSLHNSESRENHENNAGIEFNLLSGDNEFNLDAMMRDPSDINANSPNSHTGALVLSNATNNNNNNNNLSNALMLPAMGEQASGHEPGAQSAASQAANIYNKERVAPEVTLDVQLHTLMGTLYNELGAKDHEINPSQIQVICNAVDECVDDATAINLDNILIVYLPAKCVHAFNIVAKRMREFFNDDPHKKLYILYTVTRLLLTAPTEFSKFTSSCINAYLMVLLVASERQTESGMDRISALIENLEHHSFIESKACVSNEYIAEFRYQLQEIHNRVKAEQDLASLLTKRRRRAKV